MSFTFYKYQGTGNDFILIDNRSLEFPKTDFKFVAKLCDRKFGIGADGLILLENHPEYDFQMVYYNSDGNLSSMCGNGGRCLVRFAEFLEIIKEEAQFMAVDGLHYASFNDEVVSLGMNDVSEVKNNDSYVFLNTGSPHHVQVVDDVSHFPVFAEGRRIRNEVYGKEGSNVNFVTLSGPNVFKVRTYERGVEDETLSCGTGVTAVAIAMYDLGLADINKVILETPGGVLTVTFNKSQSGYSNVYLIGPAQQVFEGVWSQN